MQAAKQVSIWMPFHTLRIGPWLSFSNAQQNPIVRDQGFSGALHTKGPFAPEILPGFDHSFFSLLLSLLPRPRCNYLKNLVPSFGITGLPPRIPAAVRLQGFQSCGSVQEGVWPSAGCLPFFILLLRFPCRYTPHHTGSFGAMIPKH